MALPSYKIDLETFSDEFERKRIVKYAKSIKLNLPKEVANSVLKNIVIPKYYKVKKITWEKGRKFWYGDSKDSVEFVIVENLENYFAFYTYAEKQKVQLWITYEIIASAWNNKSLLRYSEIMRLEKPMDALSPQGQLLKMKVIKDVIKRAKYIAQMCEEANNNYE